MEIKIRKRKAPETDFSHELRKFMTLRGWLVEKTHGSLYMAGWPDLYCFHPNYRERWIETKAGYNRLNSAQAAKFKIWTKYGIRIWVLKELREYPLLFEEPNWYRYY